MKKNFTTAAEELITGIVSPVWEETPAEKTEVSVGEEVPAEKKKSSVGRKTSAEKTEVSVGEEVPAEKKKSSVGRKTSAEKTEVSVGEEVSAEKKKSAVRAGASAVRVGAVRYLEPRSERMQLLLSKGLLEKLAAEAAKRKMSKNGLVNEILEEYFADK